jgi:hypothetical protein
MRKEEAIQRENLQRENFTKEKFHKFPGKGLAELLKAREGSVRLPTSTQYRKNNLKLLKDTEGSQAGNYCKLIFLDRSGPE